MTDTVNLSDETIEKLADALQRRIAPLHPSYPVYIHPPYWNPNYVYPYVTSGHPNSGSVASFRKWVTSDGR